MKITVLIFFVFFIAIFIYGVASYSAYLSFMRNNYNSLWVELGEPSLIMNNSVNNSKKVFHFLKTKKYLDLNSSELTERSEKIVNLYRFYLICFGVAIIFVLTMIVKGKEI